MARTKRDYWWLVYRCINQINTTESVLVDAVAATDTVAAHKIAGLRNPCKDHELLTVLQVTHPEQLDSAHAQRAKRDAEIEGVKLDCGVAVRAP